MTDESIPDKTDEDSTDDFRAQRGTTSPVGNLTVYEAGKFTVVGFGGVDVPDDVSIDSCREQLFRLVEEQGCEAITFDLTGVRMIPSGIVGLLVSLKAHGLQVVLFNASNEVQAVLERMKLASMFELRVSDSGTST